MQEQEVELSKEQLLVNILLFSTVPLFFYLLIDPFMTPKHSFDFRLALLYPGILFLSFSASNLIKHKWNNTLVGFILFYFLIPLSVMIRDKTAISHLLWLFGLFGGMHIAITAPVLLPAHIFINKLKSKFHYQKIIFAILIAIFAVGQHTFRHNEFYKMNTDSNVIYKIIEDLKTKDQDKVLFSLSDYTKFKWDKAFIFGPYEHFTESYLGVRWDIARKTYRVDENERMIVFVKGNTVVQFNYNASRLLQTDSLPPKAEYTPQTAKFIALRSGEVFKLQMQNGVWPKKVKRKVIDPNSILCDRVKSGLSMKEVQTILGRPKKLSSNILRDGLDTKYSYDLLTNGGKAIIVHFEGENGLSTKIICP